MDHGRPVCGGRTWWRDRGFLTRRSTTRRTGDPPDRVHSAREARVQPDARGQGDAQRLRLSRGARRPAVARGPVDASRSFWYVRCSRVRKWAPRWIASWRVGTDRQSPPAGCPRARFGAVVIGVFVALQAAAIASTAEQRPFSPFTGFAACRRLARVIPAWWLLLPIVWDPPVTRIGERHYRSVAARLNPPAGYCVVGQRNPLARCCLS